MLLILSFAILMAVPPFHLWISAAAQRANPHSMAFVIFILQSAGLFFALRFLDGFPWLRMATLAYQALLWTGAVFWMGSHGCGWRLWHIRRYCGRAPSQPSRAP